MATKVLELDITQFPKQVDGLDGYQNAFILVRYHGLPVAKVELPVINGRINQLELQDAIFNKQNQALWDRTLHTYLDVQEKTRTQPLPKATIAVCTRNRTDDLKRCLAGFMQLPDDGQEYLIVDNCPSTDETERLVASYNGRIRYIREDRPGLNIARNTAIREAKHEIIVFNDDDAVPDPMWLRNLLPNFANPDVLCVTGMTMPLELETKAQESFEKYSPFNRGFHRIFHYGAPKAALAAGQVGVGANMAFRREVLEKVGPFDESLDAGTVTLSGGDTEMFARILFHGYHIVYEPAALSWHRHRRTWKELKDTAYGYGVGIYAYWTRTLVKERKPSVLLAAWWHLRYYQLPLLWRSLWRYPDSMPLDVVSAELWGCLHGANAYRKAVRRLKMEGGAV